MGTFDRVYQCSLRDSTRRETALNRRSMMSTGLGVRLFTAGDGMAKRGSRDKHDGSRRFND
jgi:hypothetical protein